jgi:hypothetical protein
MLQVRSCVLIWTATHWGIGRGSKVPRSREPGLRTPRVASGIEEAKQEEKHGRQEKKRLKDHHPS